MNAIGPQYSFNGIRRVFVPREFATGANSHFRKMGQYGAEGFALWAGRRADAFFRVEQLIIPDQCGMISDHGVCVRVDSDELHRLNVHLFEHDLELIAQLHSHPDAAYHSETDDTFPIATRSGAFSIVVPDFGERDFTVNNCAVYRLRDRGEWVAMSPEAAADMIVLTDDP